MEINKSFHKTLSNTDKRNLADHIIDEFDEKDDDTQWRAKAISFLRSKGASEAEIKEIIKAVAEELLL